MRTPRVNSSGGWQKLVKLPAFLAINVALLLIIGISAARETYRGWSVENEIQALNAQAVQLEGRKLQLSKVIDALSSPEHVDLEARARLGWKKEGERVFVIPGYEATSSSLKGSAIMPMEVPAEPIVSNPERWLKHFLHDADAKVIVPAT